MLLLPDTKQAVVLLLMAAATVVALQVTGLNAAILSAFAPDLALVVAVALALLCLPAAWRAWTSARRSLLRHRGFR